MMRLQRLNSTGKDASSSDEGVVGGPERCHLRAACDAGWTVTGIDQMLSLCLCCKVKVSGLEDESLHCLVVRRGLLVTPTPMLLYEPSE